MKYRGKCNNPIDSASPYWPLFLFKRPKPRGSYKHSDELGKTWVNQSWVRAIPSSDEASNHFPVHPTPPFLRTLCCGRAQCHYHHHRTCTNQMGPISQRTWGFLKTPFPASLAWQSHPWLDRSTPILQAPTESSRGTPGGWYEPASSLPVFPPGPVLPQHWPGLRKTDTGAAGIAHHSTPQWLRNYPLKEAQSLLECVKVHATHSKGRKWRGTKKHLDEGEKGESESLLETQRSKN